MSDVLDEAYGIAQCKECPWYKSCVTPMRFTVEDIRKQLEASALGTDASQQTDSAMQSLLYGMATAAQNSLWKRSSNDGSKLLSSIWTWRMGREARQRWVTFGYLAKSAQSSQAG